MEAKELQIMDLVRQKHSELQLRVHSVMPPYILAYGEEGQFHEDSIEPIPLTPEILLKNGFSLLEQTRTYKVFTLREEDKLSIQVDFFGKDSRIIVRIEKYNYESKYYMNCLHNCDIKHIHQLQQAMRLCGIMKEITLN